MNKFILILLLGITQLFQFFSLITTPKSHITNVSTESLKPNYKGSETVLSIEPRADFVSNHDNKMLAFGWFRNGFTLENSKTSCTFDSVFPVSGTVGINGGVVYLTSDLHLENIITLNDWGIFYGNGHRVTIDSSVKKITNSNANTRFDTVDLFLNSDLQISTTMFFDGSCSINGRDRRVALDPNIEIVVGKNSTLILKDINLIGVQRDNIRCLDDTGTIILDNTSCNLAGSYNFKTGSLQMLNNTAFSGSHTFFYDSSKTLTVHTNSRCLFTDGTTFGVRVNNPSYGNNCIWFDDSTSELEFENSYITVGTKGVLLTRGTIAFGGKVSVDAHSTSTSNGILFGTGITADDIIVKFYPTAIINFNNSHITYNLTNSDNLHATSSFSKIIRGPASCFYIKKNIIYSDVTIMADPVSTLLVDPGAAVGYSNCTLDMPTSTFSITGSKYNTYTMLLDGNDEIFVSDGVMPLYTLVQNSGNAIKGNGDIGGAITLLDRNADLTFNLNGQLLNYVTLNGGKINLARDLEFAHEKTFLGSGTVDLSSYNIKFGINNLTSTGSIYWNGNAGSIELNSDATLAGSWTFNGYATMQGHSHILDLQDGKIIVERGSSLLIKDITLRNVKDGNLFCMDDDSTLILQNVKIYLSDDYKFSVGSFVICDQVTLLGKRKFVYQSKMFSTITSRASLILAHGMSLIYDPVSSSKDLIIFEDDDSAIVLNGATLHASLVGMQLTKGSLIINSNSYISSEKTDSIDEGITFGNDNSQDDLHCQNLKGATLELTSGSLKYRNVLPSSWTMETNQSALIINANCNLYLYQDLNIAPGFLQYKGRGGLFHVPGKKENCSLSVNGYIDYFALN